MCVTCGCADPRPAELHVGGNASRQAADAVADAGRLLTIEADVLGANDGHAARNRALFAERRVAAYNLVSSPGSGKTTLLCATVAALRRQAAAPALAVIEGDQQTRLDADRIRAAGAPAIQVNTGHGCHLDARMVGRALEHLPLQGGDEAEALLFIENVGNLVCPALWDLGERAKVAILSVTEGHDKPLKYPDMFAAASLMVINKLDLLPHVDFDIPRCIDFALRVNPRIEVLLTSATRGDGMDAWMEWLTQRPANAQGQVR